MGHTEFLVIGNGRNFSNIEEAIEKLENWSMIFTRRWQSNQLEQAGKASEEAMIFFDHVIGELMRIRDSRKQNQNYANSDFAASMAAVAGRTKPNASQADVDSITAVSGNASLPVSTHIADLILEEALNKVKHRDPSAMNFRIEADRHVFVFCARSRSGSLESIVEFDVLSFCETCRDAAKAI